MQFSSNNVVNIREITNDYLFKKINFKKLLYEYIDKISDFHNSETILLTPMNTFHIGGDDRKIMIN